MMAPGNRREWKSHGACKTEHCSLAKGIRSQPPTNGHQEQEHHEEYTHTRDKVTDHGCVHG
jgi:hypothetical protein